MSLPIIILTGATACGKGTLGRKLASDFGFYHLSMGDARRSYWQAIMGPIPGMPDDINKYVVEHKEIPAELLARYNPVPVVLLYHNFKVNNKRTIVLASDILREKLDEARAEDFIASFSGLTIVIECPRDVAKKRYIQRSRGNEDAARFETRMEKTDEILPPFIELMAGYGTVVYSVNDDTMTIEDAYNVLLSQLYNTSIFLTLAQRTEYIGSNPGN
ncbi:P-loop containing nucleoside triphosphate hydrolase protein [Xylariaceae sp. FL1651]|nr:P-loop containing nucleoside triphosphate hydrolase protein [Xylariaceae sp. FL1651]